MGILVRNDKLKKLRIDLNYSREFVADSINNSTKQSWKAERIISIEDGKTGRTPSTVGYVEEVCKFYQVNSDDYIIYDARNTEVIGIGAGKGGTGKTTVVGEIAYFLSKKNKVLLIDGDPQGNISKMVGHSDIQEKNLRSLLEFAQGAGYDYDIKEYIHKSRIDTIDIIPFHPAMYGADRTLATNIMPLAIFKTIKDKVVDLAKYDYVLFDSSPQISTYTMGLFIMSDRFFMPLDMAAYTVDALPTFLESLKDVKFYMPQLWPGKEFKINGIIKTKIDKRKIVCREVSKIIDESFHFPTVSEIPMFTGIEQGQYQGQFLEEFDSTSRRGKELVKVFEKLSREVIK